MKKPRIHFDLDLIDADSVVASATECTGLIQIPPENDWQQESYNDIYEIPRRRNRENVRRKSPE